MKGILLSALALLCMASPLRAANLDLEGWLNEPGTKLVAVEFYADWCKPCVESAPRWEALRKKYAAQGLKLVVVNLTEAEDRPGKCTGLPWNPDESLCDPKLGELLGVESLPEAFVWSWQGNLLVERGQHVDQIEGVIRRYLDDNPRVQVSGLDLNGKSDRALQRKVEEALALSGKLTVVPDKVMQKRLAAVRKASHGSDKRDDQRCALGAEVSANSLLTAERFEGALSLSLADAETGCQRATVSMRLANQTIDQAIQKATYRLLEQLKRKQVQMPKGAKLASSRSRRVMVGEEDVSEEVGEWMPEEEDLANVTFESTPPGATVSLGDEVICEATPCVKDLTPGRQRVTMSLARYASKGKTMELEDGQTIGWKLKPTFAVLDVTSEPSGVEVMLGDKPIGKTPIRGLEVDAGEHIVEVGNACYHPKKKRLRLPAAKKHAMSAKLKARRAAIQVTAVDQKGNAIKGARVLVDGDDKGVTGKTHVIPVCSKRVQVVDQRYVGEWSQTLDLKPEKTAKFQANLGLDKESDEALQAEMEAQAAQAAAELERRREEERRAQAEERRREAEERAEEERERAEEAEDYEATYSLYGRMEHLRVDLLLGLNMCIQVDGNDCSSDESGPAVEGGIYYYTSPFFGFGIAGTYAQWQGAAELMHTRVNAMVAATLPLESLEMSAATGLGLARLASDLTGSESFGVSVPASVRVGYYVTDIMLFGLDGTANIDLFDSGSMLISMQAGLFLELVL